MLTGMRRYMSRMQTALRKMGNSVGMILPKALLKELGATAGTQMTLRLEEGKVVATPVADARAGWAEAAEHIGAMPLTEEEEEWLNFGIDGDDELRW